MGADQKVHQMIRASAIYSGINQSQPRPQRLNFLMVLKSIFLGFIHNRCSRIGLYLTVLKLPNPFPVSCVRNLLEKFTSITFKMARAEKAVLDPSKDEKLFFRVPKAKKKRKG